SALTFCRGWHGLKVGCRLDVMRALKSAEEEQLVFLDGAADRNAIDILVERLLLFGEKVSRVEKFLAMKLPGAAVKIVGARLRGQQQKAAAAAAVLRLIGVLNQAELGRGLDRRIDGEDVPFHAVVAGVSAIDVKRRHGFAAGNTEERRLRGCGLRHEVRHRCRSGEQL